MRKSVKSRSLLFVSILLVFILACQALTTGEELPEINDLPTQTATKIEATKLPSTVTPTPLAITIRVLMDNNLENGEINIEVLEGEYQLANGTTLWAGSKIWEEEQYLVFPVGLAIEVGPAGLTLKGENYPKGTMLYVDRENHLMVVGGTASTGEALNCQADDGKEEYIQFNSPFTSRGVAMDGRLSSEDEWANAFCMDMRHYEWGDMQNGKMLRASWWVQNDDQFIYYLVRVAKDAAMRGVGADYFWPRYTGTWDHSDGVYVSINGSYQDLTNWDESTWYTDDELDPPGTTDAEAVVNDDDEFYWFEIKKPLDSGDDYDWNLEPGQTIGYSPSDSFLFALIMEGSFYSRNMQMQLGESQ